MKITRLKKGVKAQILKPGEKFKREKAPIETLDIPSIDLLTAWEFVYEEDQLCDECKIKLEIKKYG